ncbi:MAG: hypothetical protein AAFX05_05695 [Planctomycetota bacterium]
MVDPGFSKRPAKYADRPRRVRGGRKLRPGNWPERLGSHASDLFRIMAPLASPLAWEEGLDYAQRGQTRSMQIGPGQVSASIQGRASRAYTTILRFPTFTHEQWELIVDQALEQAIFGAKLLSGEIPPNVDELFSPCGVHLLPRADEITGECSCEDEERWCKHLCCAAQFLVDDIDADPFLLFTLRGMPGEDLIERIRQRREVMGDGGSGPTRASAVRRFVPGAEAPSRELETCVDDFWEAGPELDLVETPLRRPDVPHPLLRRLGPTPFSEGKFPLVGLLATCYATISDAVVRERS